MAAARMSHAHFCYERLSPRTTVPAWETPPAHARLVDVIFDAGPLRTSDSGVDFAAIRRGTEAFLHRVPRYRQKLFQIPFAQHSVWVDDARFDLDFHLRHTALPKPGSEAQLKRLSARIMSQPLDRRRPLWETWIIEGLEGGERFAMITKIHHCMIDGASGVYLFQIMMSPSPERTALEPPPFMPQPTPRAASFARRAAPHALDARARVRTSSSRAPRLARANARARSRQHGGLAGGADARASSVGPHRKFDG
jgi:WS/DGAT/MGAT family acyltransferase